MASVNLILLFTFFAILVGNSSEFVEDFRYDPPAVIYESRPLSPTPTVSNECDTICQTITSCKQFIELWSTWTESKACQQLERNEDCLPNWRKQTRYDTRSNEMISSRYFSRCSKRLDCPIGFIPSGFNHRQDCIEWMQCKYLQKLHKHANEIDPNIKWC
ncbi:hypothetical protein NH340_JMT05582 [Sarcoptes scabiei]|nr:hypothetical protein NH340_JMT05582 [Sarcoptes scabiei]